MISGSLPRRYARALLALTEEEGTVEEGSRSLEAFAGLLKACPEALETLGSRSFPQSERLGLVEELGTKVRVTQEVQKLLCLLVRKERILLLPQIIREFGALRDERMGVVRVRVFAPEEPPQKLLRAIEKLLEGRLQKTIVATGKSDPSLLGGVALEVGHRRFDGSLSRHLERLREDLIRGALRN